jgi:hypothetical protein
MEASELDEKGRRIEEMVVHGLRARLVALRSSEFKLKSGINSALRATPIYSVLSLSSLPAPRSRGSCVLLLIIARSFLALKIKTKTPPLSYTRRLDVFGSDTSKCRVHTEILSTLSSVR